MLIFVPASAMPIVWTMRLATGNCDAEGQGAGESQIEVLRERTALMAMEDDLRILHGAMETLKLIGWSNQPGDLAALAFLSRFADEALERTRGSWVSAVQLARLDVE